MPLPQTTPTLSRVCLRDAAYLRLRDWIVDGTLAPDEQLRDEQLADALGMSRTPIREALQRLEDDGLVVTTPARRTFVSPLSLNQAREVFPVVASLEGLAAQLAVTRMSADALATMREANQSLAAALAREDAGAALEADTALHGAFIERGGNRELIELLADLKCKVRRIERAFWVGTDRTASLRDHDDLITAFEGSDLAVAQAVVRRNWERGLLWMSRGRGE
ncbi:MAG TPA: GntR family transcriptional regulator [Ktedonobacterales bacterium]|nr:GntR family transcriptional regulator [Ktedonobacterales bacterium]